MSKRKTMGALCLLLVAALGYAWHAYPRARTVAALTYAPGARHVAAAHRADRFRPHVVSASPVRVDLLDREPEVAPRGERNIFQPLFVSRETALAREAALAAARGRQARTAAVPPLPPEPTPLQREIAGLRVQGYLSGDGSRRVFLARGGEVFIVRQGDVFAGKFVVTALSDQMVVITVRGGGEQIMIPLREDGERRPAGSRVAGGFAD